MVSHREVEKYRRQQSPNKTLEYYACYAGVISSSVILAPEIRLADRSSAIRLGDSDAISSYHIYAYAGLFSARVEVNVPLAFLHWVTLTLHP